MAKAEHGFDSSRQSLILNPVSPTLSYINVYITKARIYVIGCSQEPPGGEDAFFRILKIDRTVPERLDITDDGVNYNRKEIEELLRMIDAGSGEKATVLEDRISAYGILGMVRFLQGYYMILITKRRKVGLIGKHFIFKIEDTVMVAVSDSKKGNVHPLENRYIRAFQNVDITSNFYFSYTYDLTRPLQANMHSPDKDEMTSRVKNKPQPLNPDMEFVWNGYLIESLISTGHTPWALYVIHGFLTQSNLSVFGRSVYVTLIARRSCRFAGTRFLKRGTNAQGNPANHVETEQIVHDASSFDHRSGRFTSFLQMRASIPCFWSQDFAKQNIKPPVQIDRRDPFASAAALHFDSSLKKYGAPIIVLDLVKKKEKRPRESILSAELGNSISYLNQFVPPNILQHITWDMHRTAKSKDGNVLRRLEEIARGGMMQTGFFHAGPELEANRLRNAAADEVGGIPYSKSRLGRNQRGLIRVNCVDCLDRTNTAQFMLGLCALQHQLYSIGVLESPSQLNFDCDAFHLLAELYEDQGDTLALQYGGSQLVNRIQTYRKASPWTTHSRDILNTVARYYSNSFTDAEKQEAMNLFLGKYIPSNSGENLWKIETDLFLHFPHIKSGGLEPVLDYNNWCSVTENSISEIDNFSCLDGKGALQALLANRQDELGNRSKSFSWGKNNHDVDYAATHVLPSSSFLSCHDIGDLKEKILTIYKPALDTIPTQGLEELQQPPFSNNGTQVRDLINFIFGTSDDSAKEMAAKISCATLANVINVFSPLQNDLYKILTPIVERLDYLEIRRVVVEASGYSNGQFDSEVLSILRGWNMGNRVADCNLAALQIARKTGVHFLPQTSHAENQDPAKKGRGGKGLSCDMYDDFYGPTRLTVLDQLYSMNMDSSARLQGQLAPKGSPFSVLSGVDSTSESETSLKTAPTLDVGLDMDLSDDENDDSWVMGGDDGLAWGSEALRQLRKTSSAALDRLPRRRKTLQSTPDQMDEAPLLPSAKNLYGVEPKFISLKRPSPKELNKYTQFVDVGGFLEGHDHFQNTELDPLDISRATTADAEEPGALYVSTPRTRDHQPIYSKFSLKMNDFPNTADAFLRLKKDCPTPFSSVPSEAAYRKYIQQQYSYKEMQKI